MADILIRGMEMPEDCPHCEFAAIGYASPMSSDCTLYCRAVDKFKDCATEILKDKPYEVISHYNDRPDWCPLLPLPEGHGRLIDADAVVKTICNSCDGACDVVQCDCLNCKADCRCDIAKEISDAPTIIEADLEWKMKNCCCFSNTDQAEGGGEECSEN